MKIQFVKNVLVEVEKPKLEEIWDKEFQRWDQLTVESISYFGQKATIYTAEGDVLIDVPLDSFETCYAQKDVQ